MRRKRFAIAAGLIACLILAAFLAVILRVQMVQAPVAPAGPAAAATTTPVVALRDTYRRGVHTLSGALTLPDACIVPTATSTYTGTASTTGIIALDISYAPDQGVCLELPTQATFSTTVAAPEAAAVVTTVNGVIATTTPL
jgi:hypothetical protein